MYSGLGFSYGVAEKSTAFPRSPSCSSQVPELQACATMSALLSVCVREKYKRKKVETEVMDHHLRLATIFSSVQCMPV